MDNSPTAKAMETFLRAYEAHYRELFNHPLQAVDNGQFVRPAIRLTTPGSRTGLWQPERRTGRTELDGVCPALLDYHSAWCFCQVSFRMDGCEISLIPIRESADGKCPFFPGYLHEGRQYYQIGSGLDDKTGSSFTLSVDNATGIVVQQDVYSHALTPFAPSIAALLERAAAL